MFDRIYPWRYILVVLREITIDFDAYVNRQKQKKTRAMASLEALAHMFIAGSPVSLNYSENPAAKKLLDAIVSIFAEEYIQKAKENPEIFTI